MRQKLAFALEPIQSFFRHEASSGILLLFFAALAMALANSAWAESYETALAMKPIAGPAEYHLGLANSSLASCSRCRRRCFPSAPPWAV